MLPGITSQLGFASRRPVTLINRQAITGGSNFALVQSYASMAIGTASATRRVIVYAMGDSSGYSGITLTSATIGGISATIDKQAAMSDGSDTNISAIISATVPTGTTATIALTYSNYIYRSALQVLAVDHLISPTPVDTLSATGTGVFTGSIDLVEGGFAIGGSSTNDGSLANAWVGLTEREDTSYDFTDVSAADRFPTSTSTVTVSSTWSGGTWERGSMAVASYR